MRNVLHLTEIYCISTDRCDTPTQQLITVLELDAGTYGEIDILRADDPARISSAARISSPTFPGLQFTGTQIFAAEFDQP